MCDMFFFSLSLSVYLIHSVTKPRAEQMHAFFRSFTCSLTQLSISFSTLVNDLEWHVFTSVSVHRIHMFWINRFTAAAMTAAPAAPKRCNKETAYRWTIFQDIRCIHNESGLCFLFYSHLFICMFAFVVLSCGWQRVIEGGKVAHRPKSSDNVI